MSKELTIDDLEVNKTYATVETNAKVVTLIEPVINKAGTLVYYCPKSRLVLDYTHFDPSIRFQEVKA